ncbi:MAG: ATP-binding cassette domain-containing protein [Victivallales bacterium]|nr:ATP-binding cassette domain-containing protein [Victivallales bacterium]
MPEKDSPSTIPPIQVKNLLMAYNGQVIQHDLNFTVNKGETFIVMGGSGCGKSTLLRHLTGMITPAEGTVLRDGIDFFATDEKTRNDIRRRSGIMYQAGGLWSSLSLAENVAFPLKEFTNLSNSQIMELASLKLALVGLAGCENLLPAEISGGMIKRASLARAMALDPDILFFDEPSAGLDPISARRLDELIIELRNSLGTTIVVVTHDLDSIFAIATNAIFLDEETKTLRASGPPKEMLASSTDEKIIRFLTRGEKHS